MVFERRLEMNSSLLDRILSAAPLSWRHALRVLLITVAFQVGWWVIVLVMLSRPQNNLSEIGFALLMAMFTIPSYWAVFFLAAVDPEEAKGAHPWRVWTAWLLITFTFASGWFELSFSKDRGGAAHAMAVFEFLSIALSPVVALVGAFVGYLLYLCFGRIEDALRADRR
jgi:hypothetical protein